MITHSSRILIGANGWLHPAWQTWFYPDDLPDDWLLAYYSNDFPVVLMPAAYWQTSMNDIQDCLEDSSDHFRIVCEVPPGLLQKPNDEVVNAINDFINGLSILGEHCIGLLLPVMGCQTGINEIISQLDRRLPLCIELVGDISISSGKTIQKMCEQQGVGLCWHGEGSTAGLGYGPLAIARIDSQGMAMRQLRDIVEMMLSATILGQTSVLIIDGHPPDVDAIRHAGVILDLF